MFPEASRQKCEQRKNKEQSENVTWETINLLFDMLQRYLSGVPNTSVPKKMRSNTIMQAISKLWFHAELGLFSFVLLPWTLHNTSLLLRRI